jgi:hypothetical protein
LAVTLAGDLRERILFMFERGYLLTPKTISFTLAAGNPPAGLGDWDMNAT